MEKLPIFISQKERFIIFSSLFLLFFIQLSFIYKNYQEFISKPFYYTDAKVIYSHQKSKNGRSYKILKLRLEDGKSIYTSTTKRDNFEGKSIRLKLYPKEDITFLDYLRGFFIYSKVIKILPQKPSLKEKIRNYIYSQHKNRELASLYSAIFLATPLDSIVRERMTLFGVNHLVALSGFHLGILSSSLILILLPIYRVLQRRFFPWRSRDFDLGVFTLGVLFIYLCFVDFPPSLVRSYAMMLLAWVALMLWVELFSFEFVAIVVALILAISPEMVVSLSFWLSVAGVFYIFLILHYIKDKRILAIALPFLIHILMIPIAHSIFDEVSIYQWLSPLISWLFIPFYPLSLLAHIFGFGGVFDNFLLYLWRVPIEFVDRRLPIYFAIVYIIFTILATRYKISLYITIFLSLVSIFYLYL